MKYFKNFLHWHTTNRRERDIKSEMGKDTKMTSNLNTA